MAERRQGKEAMAKWNVRRSKTRLTRIVRMRAWVLYHCATMVSQRSLFGAFRTGLLATSKTPSRASSWRLCAKLAQISLTAASTRRQHISYTRLRLPVIRNVRCRVSTWRSVSETRAAIKNATNASELSPLTSRYVGAIHGHALAMDGPLCDHVSAEGGMNRK